MTIDELRCALRGVAAYRHIVDAPLMGLTLELLDRLASGDGTGAVERYARLFYELRQADCSGWACGCTTSCGTRNRPMPGWWSGAERIRPWRRRPGGMWRPSRCFPSWTATRCCGRSERRRPGNFPACWPICPGGAEDAPLPFRGLRRFIRPTGRAFSPATTPFYGRMGLCGRWSSPTAPVPAR